MNERGDKIICLAQELLRGERSLDAPAFPPPSPEEEKKAARKAALVAAMLAAVGMSLSAQATHEANRPATRYERVEIDALLFYTARESGLKETNLRTEIEDWIAQHSLEDMTVRDYKRIRHYLWLRLDEKKKQPVSLEKNPRVKAQGRD